jgi:hypothetical protein
MLSWCFCCSPHCLLLQNTWPPVFKNRVLLNLPYTYIYRLWLPSLCKSGWEAITETWWTTKAIIFASWLAMIQIFVVSPKLICWDPNLKGDAIRKSGLLGGAEVIRADPLWTKLVPSQRRPQGSDFVPSLCEDELSIRKGVLTTHLLHRDLDLGLPSFQKSVINICWLHTT